MQDWAVNLQRFFVSGTLDQEALRLAAQHCDDPEIRTYLSHQPTSDQEALSRGQSLVSHLVDEGLKVEAIVLQLFVFWPMMQMTENAIGLSPEQRLSLGETLNKLRRTVENTEALQPSLAHMSATIGAFRHNLGNFATAREAYREARDIYTKLAIACPKTHEFGLAAVLTNLGNLHRNTSELAAAQKAYEEARDIWRRLARTDPRTYEHHLASTLNNLGNLYLDTRDLAAAQKTYEEARDIWRRLAKADPRTYEHHLALALNELGNLYRGTKDFAAVRGPLEEARDIWRRLAMADPRTYEHYLADILSNLGAFYSETREFTNARGVLEEARDISRKLAKAGPKSCEDLLAGALHRLGFFYSNTREFDSARAAYEEARDIWRRLAMDDSQAYESDLALTLNNLGTVCSDTRDFTASRMAHEEARDIWRRLAMDDSQAYESNLAATNSNLGLLYSETWKFDAARDALDEALDIWRKLTKTDQKLYEYDLAGTLTNLGYLYWHTRNFAAAQKAYEEARNIRRRLAKADPQTYENDLAKTFNDLGSLYGATGDYAAAHGAYEEAREIQARLAEADPNTYGHFLAQTFNNIGSIYSATREFASARAAYEKAITQVEAVVTDHQRYLSKGCVTAAYRFLLGEAVDAPTLAFRYAAAVRDGPARSSALGQYDLYATQCVIRCIERRIDRAIAVLIPTSEFDDTISLGLITASDCQWWRTESKGWTELFLEDARETDHSARHRLARRIWSELPDALQEVLASTSSARFEILISGDRLWSAFPWELLCFGEGVDDFLGLHKALPRIGSILAPALEQTMAATSLGKGRRVAIVAPHTTGPMPLLGVEIEVESLKGHIPKVGGELIERKTTGSAAHEGLMRRAIDAAPDVLWYSGHGAIVANEEVLVLHVENPRGYRPEDNISYFGAYQLNKIANTKGLRALFDHAPLVVLNSCMTGRTREFGGQREDMVEAFLKHGAGAVIATALPIFDSVGEALGGAMLSEEAIAKSKIGDVVVEARRQLAKGICRDIRRSTWGAWGMVHLHGNAIAAGPFYESEGTNDE